MGFAPGDVVEGKYRIVRLLGEGGMGVVYEGENIRIRHRVAIKVLHAAVAAAPQVVERFEREAQAAGQIGSEHIVEVLDLGVLPNGESFMVMEFLDGQNLAQRLQAKGRLTAAELLPLMLQMLDGLGAAHNAGIVHRDLKPENVFLLRSRGGTRDFVKILDFGISKFTQGDAEGRSSATRTGSVMGTPSYMSPEQAKGSRDIDHRTDLYAVGVILYECLTGTPPFTGETFNEVLFKVVLEPARPILELVPEADSGFLAIVDKAMAKAREERFQNAAEFQQALVEWATAAGVRMLAAGSGSFTDSRISMPHSALAGRAGLSPSGAYATQNPSGSEVVRAKTPMGFTPPRGTLPSDALGPTRLSDPAAQGRPATVGSWATSGVDGSRAAPGFTKRKGAGVVLLAAGLFGVCGLAGGAGWFFLHSRAPSAAPDVAAANAGASREQKAPEAPAPAATAAPNVSPATEPAPTPAASSSAPPESSALAARSKHAPPAAKAPSKAAPPAAASAKAAGSAAKPPTVSGRKIYTEL